MSLGDMFKVKQYKEESERLERENENLKALMTPEMQDAWRIKHHIEELSNQLTNINKDIDAKQSEFVSIQTQITLAKEKLIVMDEDILVQEFGLYQPKYAFANSDVYKDKLQTVRSLQKQMLKSNTAANGNMNWTVNGSASQGKKMVKDMQKLLIRAFNSECDELIDKVKYNNFEPSLKRINSSRDAISKLGTIMNISISNTYYDLKIQEMHLALEYQMKKQEEKEALKEAKAEMREAAKLQKELDEQRKKVEKEQVHYQKALLQVLKQIENSDTPSKELLDKKKELENQLGEIEHTIQDLDYREANQRAGYVYVISNIGAFGENIFKIGMTRRLEPQDRIDELGSASVPFNFDLHAMIFSDDAPSLENALHKAFENRKLNIVNPRREFFNVSLEEIKEVIRKNYDKTVEFADIPDARQYRESQLLRQKAGQGKTVQKPNNTCSPAIAETKSQRTVLDPSKKYLHTKWGIYEMPNPYSVYIKKGARSNLKEIIIA